MGNTRSLQLPSVTMVISGLVLLLLLHPVPPEMVNFKAEHFIQIEKYIKTVRLKCSLWKTAKYFKRIKQVIMGEDNGWRILHFQEHYTRDEEAAVGHHSDVKNQCNLNIEKDEHEDCNKRHFAAEGDRGLSVVPVDEGHVKNNL